MKKILATAILAISFYASNAQEINFIEYDLDNGLHVILHQDNTAPVITTAVSYHVGSKDEEEGRTGFAHFFEHGSGNASTSVDLTSYYVDREIINPTAGFISILRKIYSVNTHIIFH